MNTVFVISLVVIALVSMVLAFWKEYKDGILGHAALGLMAGSSALILIGLAHGYDFYYTPLTVGLTMGIAVFLSRHAYRAWVYRTPKNVEERREEKRRSSTEDDAKGSP